MTGEGKGPGRVELTLVRLALRTWPRRDRLEAQELVVRTFSDRRAGGPTISRVRALADTLLECADIAGTGLRLRWSASGAHPRSGLPSDRRPPRRTPDRTAADLHRRRPTRTGGAHLPTAVWDLATAGVRSLRRRSLWAVSVVAILAVGIGAAVSVFAVVDAVLLRSLPYQQPDRLLRIGGIRAERPGLSTVSGPNFRDLESATTRLASVAASTPGAMAVSRPGETAELVRGGWVSGGFFPTLGVGAAAGRTLGPDDDRPGAPLAVVVSHAFRQARFPIGDVVGATLLVEGTPATVVGVMPPEFVPPEGAHLADTRLWAPLNHSPMPVEERGLSFLDVVGRMAADASEASVADELGSIGAGIQERYGLPPRAFGGFAAVSLEKETVGDAGRTLTILVAAVLLLLAIAAANVANLVLLRALDRTAEVRIRIGLGAGRARLVAESLMETSVLAVLAGGIGAAAAYQAVDAVRRAAPVDLPRLAEAHVDARVLAFALALSLGMALLVGLAPVLHVLRREMSGGPGRVVAGIGGRGATLVRDALVVSQVAMGLVLLLGAGLLVRSLARLHAADPGFETADLYTVSLRLDGEGGPGADVSPLDRLASEASRLPGVSRASLTSGAPFTSGGWTVYVQPEGVDLPDEELARSRIGLHQVSPGHLRHLGVRFLGGRDVALSDGPEAVPVVVVSESIARRYWPAGDALGHRLVVGGDGTFALRTIVGVVAAPSYAGPTTPSDGHIWLPYAQFPPESIDVMLTARDAPDLAVSVREMVRRVDPDIAIRSIERVEAAQGRYLVQPAFFATLSSVFAAVALLLSGVGLYGALSYAVTRRRGEMGVRLALGATASRLVGAVVVRGLVVVGLGLSLGLVGARIGLRPLEAFLHGVPSADPLVWVGAAGMLVVVGALACWVPARAAGRTDPVECLRP